MSQALTICRHLFVAGMVATLLIGTAGSMQKAVAQNESEATPQDPKELLKQYQRLRSERYYRQASTLYGRVLQYSQIEPQSMSPADRFVRAFFEGDWGEISGTLDRLPDDFANEIYNRMLGDLAGRNVPLLTLDDFLGLADVSPSELDTDRIRKLGLLLRIAVSPEQEIWLKQALEKGSRYLGGDGAKRTVTGRVLMHAGFDSLARTYLPSVAQVAQIEDAAVRDEILAFLASQEELDQFQQTRIAHLWEQQASTLTDPGVDIGKRQEAANQLADLLGKAQATSFEPWLRELALRDRDAILRLAIALGQRAQGRINDADVSLRTSRLAAQKVLLACAGETVDLSKPPWDSVAVAMADWWIQEAEHSFEFHPAYRKPVRSKPHVVPGELLQTAPDGRWAQTLPESLRDKVDVCLSKAVLVSDQYQDAAALIAKLADRNPRAGVSLAEEYLKAWAHRHNPEVPEAVRKKYDLTADARIAVTPIMMEKNIEDLSAMMNLFREKGVTPANGELLVDAFDVCYSNADVYRRTHIEKVFGPIDQMDGSIFDHMVRMMTEGLSSRWRTMEVQLDAGTRRTQRETLEMVRDGYQTAIDMIEERCRVDHQNWTVLSLAGSLLSDWGDFEYYQQLAGDTGTDRMELFRKKNNQAEAYFMRASEAYAKTVGSLRPGQYSIDLYLAWFHSLLGINSDGRLNLAKPMDRQALSALRDAIRGLPEEISRTHIDKFAKHVQDRMDDTEHPLHEEMKYKYLTGSLVITKESPFAFHAGDKVAYYDELLDETRLTTRVDGPNTIYRDHEFGIILSVQHTEALGRMADFGKYLVNDLPPAGSTARRNLERSLAPTYQMGDLQGRRDQMEMNIVEALGLFFDIKAIAFSPKDVQPRPVDQPGWEETVLAYIHVKAKDASVDKIPSIQMSLEFLDLTGPVRIITESAETMIKMTDQPTPPRPFDRVDMTQVLDPRNLTTSEEISLAINVTACGLVPELGELVDLEELGQRLPISRVDPHEGTVVRQVNSWGDNVHAVSERQWTVVLDASSLIDPPRQIPLELPDPKVDANVAYQAYVEMDLVDLDKRLTTVGTGDAIDSKAVLLGADRHLVIYFAIGGGALLLFALLLLIAIFRMRTPRERPLRARDVFHMPSEIDGFVVVQLLRSLNGSELVRMSRDQRVAIERDIEQIQVACFGGRGEKEWKEDELRGVAHKWLRLARS